MADFLCTQTRSSVFMLQIFEMEIVWKHYWEINILCGLEIPFVVMNIAEFSCYQGDQLIWALRENLSIVTLLTS